jgi:diacylglycerol O-acyltransferase / wax synthase
MSSADAAWLHMDRPTNLMVINAVLLFDQPLDIDRVKRVCAERLIGRFPKFRQRVVESSVPFRSPAWEDDPDFDLDHHVHHFALPAPNDKATLEGLVADLMTTPLDRDRPLWHNYVVDGFGQGSALIVRMHHCIADGIALARVMLSLTDPAPAADTEPELPLAPPRGPTGGPTGGLAGGLAGAFAGAGRVAYGAARQSTRLLASPTHVVSVAGAIGRDAGTALRLLLTRADAATAFKGEPGLSRRVAWSSPLSLAQVKQIGHEQGATVNDVLLAAVSGALRHYLQGHGSGVSEIQAMVPFNLRGLDDPLPRELGNKFGLVFLPLPVGTSGSYRRLTEVRRRMKTIKEGRDGAVSYGMLSATGLSPEPVERRIVDMFSGKATAVMTNVPGPTEPVYFAGAPVRTVLVWAPTSGHIGMSVSIFSYRGEVTVGLMVDANLIPDPEAIVIGLERELEMLALLHPLGRDRRPSPAQPEPSSR